MKNTILKAVVGLLTGAALASPAQAVEVLLAVTKDASTLAEETWGWEVTKQADVDKVTLGVGEDYVANYTVTVSPVLLDFHYTVAGTIYVTNLTDALVEVSSVTDKVDGMAVDYLSCGGVLPGVLGPLQAVTCGYLSSLPDATTRTNTATVTAYSIDYSATADVIFDLASGIITDECVDVYDDHYGSLGTVCTNDGPKTFTYSLSLDPYSTAGEYYFDNVVTAVTNDTDTRISSVWTIDVTVVPVSVPEPATLALFGLGLAGLGAVRRKKLAA